MKRVNKRQAGFTLIELIITIVVIGIMVMGIAGFIELGTKGYADTVDRQQLQNQARFVVEKITREIRHAVPNSFEQSEGCISFYPIDYAGAYAVLPTSDDTTFQFIVVNTELTTPADLNGKQLVINPSVQDDLENGTNHIDLANVQESSDDDGVLQTDVDSSQFNQGAVTNSVGDRLYIYSNKVSYCLEGSRLERNGVTVGDFLTADSSFASGDTNSPNSDSLSRSGLIHIKLSFKQNDETTEYENDIQVLNVP
ncbi:MAG: PilW family protein [Vibrio litoralis]|uniref:PilW family protein n=1 Tax=Vibrio litoralis TaxID=335972 RepID=UPI003F9E9AAF